MICMSTFQAPHCGKRSALRTQPRMPRCTCCFALLIASVHRQGAPPEGAYETFSCRSGQGHACLAL